MRNLVFALVLANLGFLAWARWFVPAAAPPPTGEREFGDIMLASEFAAANPALQLPTVRIDEATDAAAAGDTPDGGADAPQSAGLRLDAVEFVDVPAADSDAAAADAAGPGAAGDASDQDAATSAGVQASAAASGAPATSDVCMSVGPFRELSQVTAAAANLRADGLEPSQRAGEGEIWSGYWVYIEQIESVAAAQTMLEQLKENGITDAYVIPRSDSGTLISLGVFSEIIRASRIRERVRNLGFDATIADRVRRATVYWIDVELADGRLLDFDRLQPPGRIIRLEQRPCAEVDL